jgi:hypothetical protein
LENAERLKELGVGEKVERKSRQMETMCNLRSRVSKTFSKQGMFSNRKKKTANFRGQLRKNGKQRERMRER